MQSIDCNVEREYIWPEGKMPDAQPHQIAAMTNVSTRPDFNPDEWRRPYIDWFKKPAADKFNGKCMVLISGGGYNNLCDVGLLEGWRDAFMALGFQVVNLVYRTPRSEKGLPIYQAAWDDGQRAMRLIRSQAAKRGFDPERICTISQSAGSHMNLLLATSSLTRAYTQIDDLDDLPCNPNIALVFSAAYGTTDSMGVRASRGGDAPDVTLVPEFKFDAKTCPICMTHGGNDAYTPMTSTLIYRRLRSMRIPAELHLYPDMPHGAYGFERTVEFLRQMGWLGELAPEEAILERFGSDEARAEVIREKVWPDGKMPDAQSHQCEPYIEWHIPKVLRTRAIQIIYSGGCYDFNGPDTEEVAPPRRYLNEKGVTVVTLRYRTPRPKYPLAKHTTAWQDLQRTVRIVRSEAENRGLDPNRIGIMGFSAGGHLTFMGATSSRHLSYNPIDELDAISCKAQWAVAIYPAYVLTDGMNGENDRGGNDDAAILAPEFSFDLDTPPMLFVHGDSDRVAAMASVKCWEQLRRMGIQGALHTLALRWHCFQFKSSPGTGSYTYIDRVWEFLNDKGFLKDYTAES